MRLYFHELHDTHTDDQVEQALETFKTSPKTRHHLTSWGPMSERPALSAGGHPRSVANKRDLNAFIKHAPVQARNWVPPLLRLQAELFSPRKNAFFKHADVQLMLAHKDGRVAGRISAHIDHEHNRYWNERTGFFGFFESEDDPEVTTALLSAAEEWLRARGMDRIRGPMNFSTNGEVGFLVDGHDSRPVVMMPYTHAYTWD
jgi:hypothetical protein